MNEYTQNRLHELRSDIEEIERMKKMEQLTAPLFFVVFVVAIAVVANEFICKHQCEQQYMRISEVVEQCANGSAVALGNRG